MRLTLILALAATMFAQSKPDFTGTWSLNRAESHYNNPSAMPAKLLKIVEMKGDSLHYIVERDLKGDGKLDRMDVNLDIGGADPDSNVTAKWEGVTMVVTIVAQSGARQIEHWTLEPGGKRLTDSTTIQQPGKPDAAILRVYDKQ